MSVKTEILRILIEADGEYVSGQNLGRQLFCSRNAVWKAISSLREDGYCIEAVTNRGYVLRGGEVLSAEGIAGYLTAPLSVEVRDCVTSTNDVLKAAAEQGAPEGTVLASVVQKKGKGRLGRSFFSPASGLYVSILLRPTICADEALMITTAAAVSVAGAVEKICGKQCGIKWVNDVFLEGLKICGILTEASMDFETGGLQYAVVGIGVNIANPPEEFPEELRGIAGAVFDTLPPNRDIKNRLCAAIINNLYGYYKRLPERPFMEEYRRRSILIGKPVYVLQSGARQKATVLDIDSDARLLVRYEDGAERALSTGEVSIRFA